MARNVCTAGAVGPFSFIIMNQVDYVTSTICDHSKEISSAQLLDVEQAKKWTYRRLDALSGRGYETE